MNHGDIQFLLSALIQVLPTVLSLLMIALFAFMRDYKYKKNTWFNLAITIVLTLSALLFNIIVLLGLDSYISSGVFLPQIAVIFSYIVIWVIFFFLYRILKFIYYSKK